MEQDKDIQRARRLLELQDYFSEKYHCNIISGENTVTLIRDSRDYNFRITRETFVGTDQELEMYQEARALKLLLKL